MKIGRTVIPSPKFHDWRPLYPFGSRHLGIDGHRMHYLDEGEGDPLLFVHGNPTWSFLWRNQIRLWRDRFRCLAVDHIGMGLSDKPQEYPYCLETHATNLARFIEHHDLTRITLVAHDWGGAIGLLASTMVPGRFGRYVLYNTGAFPPPRVPRRIALGKLPVVGEWAIRFANAFALAAQVMASENPSQLDPAVRDGLLAPYDHWRNRVGIQRFVDDIPLNAQHPTHAVLADLESKLSSLAQCPFLFVWGMRDWCFTPDCLEQFLRHLPDAEVHRIATAGHWVTEDAEDEVLEVVSTFLKTVPARMFATSLL